MPINRDFWLEPFHKDHFPNWICPKCEVGILRPLDKTFSFEESGDITMERIRAGEYFDYDAYTFRYSVLLKCNNQDCQERISSCGHGYVREAIDGEDKYGVLITNYAEVFVPEYFYPALKVFSISKKYPDEVVREIESSFKLFFSDPPASANYIRKAVDAILTNRKIKRYVVNNKRKRVLMNLHNRIVEFEKSKPDAAKKLFAIKWLGNEGSHTDKITKNDVLDAYEILESVLDELYVGYVRLLEKKILIINKTKRPLHPST
jgi:hypothetical protein